MGPEERRETRTILKASVLILRERMKFWSGLMEEDRPGIAIVAITAKEPTNVDIVTGAAQHLMDEAGAGAGIGTAAEIPAWINIHLSMALAISRGWSGA